MAHKSRVIVVCVALLLGACSKQQPANKETPAPTPPSGPAAAVQPNTYQGVGVVKGINSKAPSFDIDHEEIVGLMPAMQMEFPVTDGALLSGLAVNDRIDFTVVEKTGVIKVTAIKKK
jgi:Cu/Ag efflux protein CusF